MATLIAVNYAVLYRTGELDSLKEIVKDQKHNLSLYGGLSEGLSAYKYEAYLQRRPEIVAIGTSRAMQIRDYFFTKSFYNLGGLVHGQNQAFALMDQLILKLPPKTIIFTVDFWTFCTQKFEFPPFKRPTGNFHDGQGNPSNPLLLMRLFLEGNLSTKNLRQIFKHAFFPPQRALRRVGISTLLSDSGFGPDGSFFKLQSTSNFNTVTKIKSRTQNHIEALQQSAEKLPINCQLSKENLSLLTMLGNTLAEHNINLVVIAPPITKTLLNAIKTIPSVSAYMTKWRQQIKEAWLQTYDFTDPQDIGANDCEFYDNIHGGEVAYARIFRNLSERGSEDIKGSIDVKSLDRVIEIGKNKITVALSLPEEIQKMELSGVKPCIPSQN